MNYFGSDDYAIGESCDVCGYTTKITPMFTPQRSKSYYCKCNHPQNQTWLGRLKSKFISVKRLEKTGEVKTLKEKE